MATTIRAASPIPDVIEPNEVPKENICEPDLTPHLYNEKGEVIQYKEEIEDKEEEKEFKEIEPVPTEGKVEDSVIVDHGEEYKLFEETDLEEGESPFEELALVDCLLISRKLLVSKLFMKGQKTRCEVRTADNKVMYTTEQVTKWWHIAYSLRPLNLRILDSSGSEVMRLYRPDTLIGRLCPCRLQTMLVLVPPGHLIGTVDQVWTPVRPILDVKKADGESVFRVQGPRVTVGCFKDVKFTIRRSNGAVVGVTCKKWQGLCHLLFVGPFSGRIGVAFERTVTNEEKALLLATSFLIDYMYYEV